MPTKHFTPILGKRLRITEVDESGVVIPGPEGTHIVTSGFISITLSSEVEDGTEILLRRADGALCVNEKSADSFKNFGLELTFCGVNPSLLAVTTNAEGYEDYDGDVAGITVAEGAIEKWFALELWTGLSSSASASASGYLLLPFVNAGVLGDITADSENAVTFSLTGARTKGGNSWGVGPYEVLNDTGDVPAELPTALDPLDHLLLVETTLSAPAETNDPEANPTVGP